MSEQHTVMQLLAKNNIILDKNYATMIENNNPDKEYSCDKYFKSKGFTLLHKLVLIAGKYPKLSDVIKEYILLYPEEVNKVNEKGWSALLLAASNKVLEIVKLLVEHNVNVNVKNDNGRTALMFASCHATKSSLEIVKLLVEYNADVNVKNIYGSTALIYASYFENNSSSNVAKLLLEYDSMPNNEESNIVKNIKVLNAKN